MIRIGHGYDVHAFEDGDHVLLGGVRIDHGRGLRAHSDGDVAVHALCDALLGAAALGDIGHHFPNTDPQYAGADSRVLLRRVVALLGEHGWCANNADLTIVAQLPKLAPHLQAMRAKLAADLQIDVGALNVKATTTEGLGFAGREEGIAAHAVVTIRALSTARGGGA